MFEGLTSPDNPNDADKFRIATDLKSLIDTAGSFFPNTYTDATHSNFPLPHQQQDVGNIPSPPTVAPELRRSRRLEAARLVAKRTDTKVHVSSSANSLDNNASPLLSSQRKEESESFNAQVSQVNKKTPSDIVVSRKTNVLHSVSTRATLAVKSQSTQSSNTGRGVKAKCSNCGVTHTPLWRRGLNGELNCNACGLYYNLHKRPRPESMRNSRGVRRVPVASLPSQREKVDMLRCYNCQTTSTTLWRKDEKGKTACNACGLYYNSKGSARPISKKLGAALPTRTRKRSHTSSPGNSRSSSLVPNRPPKRRRMSTGAASKPPSRAGSARSGDSGGRSDSP